MTVELVLPTLDALWELPSIEIPQKSWRLAGLPMPVEHFVPTLAAFWELPSSIEIFQKSWRLAELPMLLEQVVPTIDALWNLHLHYRLIRTIESVTREQKDPREQQDRLDFAEVTVLSPK